jgi:16S rRNA A1518/A1519 N6-dimethyltransferase RsmA/KsgA/DIM1 with predicted DNA glycosylase/AP lyase activity
VESALVAFRRQPLPERFAELRTLVSAAFAHRRKTLANALELAGGTPRGDTVAALATLGHGPATRAEALAPDEFPRLLDALG